MDGTRAETIDSKLLQLHDRPTSVAPFRERPPRCPRSTGPSHCGWCQNGDSADTENERSQFFNYRMGLVEEMATPTRNSKVRATAEGGDRPFRWGLWNTGTCSRLLSLQLLLSIFSSKGSRNFSEVFPHLPDTLLPPVPPSTNSYQLYMLLYSMFCLCGFFRPIVVYLLPL